MLVLGLTGGMAAGKTTVARAFRRLGMPVFDADVTVRRLQREGGGALPLLEQAFPGVIQHGRLDRGRLRDKVAGDPAALKVLEDIIHPLVRTAREAFLRQCQARNVPLCVLDVPLLWESGAAESCDLVLVVEAPLSLRLERISRRHELGGRMSVDVAKKLIARQMTDEERRQKADFVIRTDGTRRQTVRQVWRLVQQLSGDFPRRRPYLNLLS